MKCYILVVFVLLFYGLAFGQTEDNNQTIHLTSFVGKDQKVAILSDYGRDILSVTAMGDTIRISDCTRIETTAVLNKSFLEIVYRKRAGSGLHEECTLIVGCRSNKLYQLCHFISLFHEDFIDCSKKHSTPNRPDVITHYIVKSKISATEYPDYKMTLSVHSENKSEDHPLENYYREKDVVLNFDTVENIFYSIRNDLSRYFKVYDPKTQEEMNQYIKGNFPAIALDDYQYYYIKGEWYLKNIYNDLTKLSY